MIACSASRSIALLLSGSIADALRPITSSARYPNRRSAAAFHAMTSSSAVIATIASSDDSTMSASWVTSASDAARRSMSQAFSMATPSREPSVSSTSRSSWLSSSRSPIRSAIVRVPSRSPEPRSGTIAPPRSSPALELASPIFSPAMKTRLARPGASRARRAVTRASPAASRTGASSSVRTTRVAGRPPASPTSSTSAVRVRNISPVRASRLPSVGASRRAVCRIWPQSCRKARRACRCRCALKAR